MRVGRNVRLPLWGNLDSRFARIRYVKLRWTVTCNGRQTFLFEDASEEERAAAGARLQAHAAACLLGAAHTHLSTELGRLGDLSYRITVERITAREASLLIDVWYGARNWLQLWLRVFWFPARGWPRLAHILREARMTFLQGIEALCHTDSAPAAQDVLRVEAPRESVRAHAGQQERGVD